MRHAGWTVATVVAAAGCVGGTSLAGGDDDRDEVTPVDGAEADDAGEESGADADWIGDPGTDVDSTSEVSTEADVSADARDVSATCGNAVLEYGEECDDGVGNSDSRPDACRLACVARACGDGVVDTGERCDDGNRLNGDGCPASCFPDDEPPATPVGDPVVADDPVDAGGSPKVAWNGSGWGIAWGGWGSSHFAALDVDANLLAPSVFLPLGGGITGLEWHDGTYGITFISGWPGGEGGIALLDAAGAVRAGPSWPPSAGEGADLAWAPSHAAWILAYMEADVDGTGGEVIRAVAVDDRAGFLGAPVSVAAGGREDGQPTVVSTEAGVVVAWTNDDGAWYNALRWPDSTGDAPHRLPVEAARSWGVEAVSYGTNIVFGWGGGGIRVVEVDGWSLEPLGDAVSIGEGKDTPRFAAVPERGYLGYCTCLGPSDSSETDRVLFRVIRPDGSPLGSAVTIRDGLRNAGGCSVAWSGTEFVVVYWWCGGDAAWNTIYAQRVRPEI